MMKYLKLILASLFLLTLLSSCSNSKEVNLSNVKDVQQGTVVSVKLTPVKAKPIKPNGGFGVSIGSGGHTGIFGSIDLATIGRILSSPPKENMMQEIIVKRDNGSLVAITQPDKGPFRRGDRVKIIHQGNQARVIH